MEQRTDRSVRGLPGRLGALILVMATWPLVSNAATQINEIRTDNAGSDSDEYFEIKGAPGTDLSSLTYVVLGDGVGTPRCGVIECVVPLGTLTPHVIQPDGYLAVCRQSAATSPSITLAGYDVTGISAINFENSDNVTHLLVSGFSGFINADLDTNDDGVLDATPWSTIVDAVGLVGALPIDCSGPVNTTERIYATTTVGPDGTSFATHVYRCADTNSWVVGQFALYPVGVDSPGGANPGCAPLPVKASSWSGIKLMRR